LVLIVLEHNSFDGKSLGESLYLLTSTYFTLFTYILTCLLSTLNDNIIHSALLCNSKIKTNIIT